MRDRVLFLTGHLAEPRLKQVLEDLAPEFDWEIRDIGIQVAGLMTVDLIRKRLPRAPVDATRVIVPGRTRGDLDALGREMDLSFERGPDDLNDLPRFFNAEANPVDLSQHNVRIFADIVDAPVLTVAEIVAMGRELASEGADVIDIGCLPDTPFDHLEQAIAALHEVGLKVSVDSANPDDLRRGGLAGCDFILSLNETTIDLAMEMAAIPVVIPTTPEDPESLYRAIEIMEQRGLPYIADPILAPVPFGFAKSLVAYEEARRRLPGQRILMGVGNATELMDADTTGINAVLFGIIAELGITDVLAVRASPHCRRSIIEADHARRLMFAAAASGRLPIDIDTGLMALRDRRPFTATPASIAETAEGIRDANYRIEVAEDGIHVYNRDGHHITQDAFSLYSKLNVEADGGHAFYLGVELARAEIAFKLGKRYVQDEDLEWGTAVTRREVDLLSHKLAGPTIKKGRE